MTVIIPGCSRGFIMNRHYLFLSIENFLTQKSISSRRAISQFLIVKSNRFSGFLYKIQMSVTCAKEQIHDSSPIIISEQPKSQIYELNLRPAFSYYGRCFIQ